MSRRAGGLVVGVLVVALVVIGVVGFALGQGRGATPTAALGAPRFVDETAAAGIDHVYDGGPTFAVGGGVAVFDCDDDGKPDVYLAGGSRPAALYRNDSPPGGALAFTRLSDPATDLTDVTGAYPIDIDGDGQIDLAVLRVGETVILRGLGGCRFERGERALGDLTPGRPRRRRSAPPGRAAAGLPTLAFGSYLTLDTPARPASLRRQRAAPAGRGGRRLRPRRSRSRPATAPCRCCSATGIAPAGATCG